MDLDDIELLYTRKLHGIVEEKEIMESKEIMENKDLIRQKYGLDSMNENLLGIVRRLDELGRIVIPKEVRKELELEEGMPLEMIPFRDGIFIRKFEKIEGKKND